MADPKYVLATPGQKYCPVEAVVPNPSLVAKTNRFYKIPVFLSHPTSNTLNNLQISFLIRLMDELKKELLFPRTLPNTEQYPESTMISIRRMIYSSYGMVTLNLARKKVRVIETNGATVYSNDINTEYWTGSTFSFIEPAMAFQYGLPQLFITEALVANQDVYEAGGITPFRVLVWDSSQGIDYFFMSVEWKEMLQNWSAEVRSGYFLNTQPPYDYVPENQ
ncbi:hypothetical protein [Clostridium manihotivorum]|uniref:Uncharacterized protein n=1 Tax=Clostridium manihotivorum TaxID=2320868 RepID=A0A3R5TJA2_9CLOT|nr:hypothetical protein [Clostridium manihotivorum]QAA34781.1 hypothetical protein C1I91_25825 [Clostridium manihotivorum]